MNPVRENARSFRLRVEAGERFTLAQAAQFCVTADDALTVFDGLREEDGGTMPLCCGADVEVSGGILGQMARCPRCGAEAREATSPMYSPFLERGDSYVSLPSPKLLELFGVRDWIVTHEGDRP